MSAGPVKEIVICGNGLAAWMTAAGLARSMPDGLDITVVETPNSDDTDVIYGTVTTPTAYSFFLNLGLTEADLLLRTNSVFSYGTHYRNWAKTGAAWMQCFHNPLPAWDGIPFTDHVAARQKLLPDYLVSARAAMAGKFAHPPPDKSSPLSAAEYGYQFRASELTRLLKTVAMHNGARSIPGVLEAVSLGDRGIQKLNLAGGESLRADLYIDASGPQAQLMSHLGQANFRRSGKLDVLYSEHGSTQVIDPFRTISADTYGWQSETPLRDSLLRMTVFDSASEDVAKQAHAETTAKHLQIATGQRKNPWQGNCVAVGQTAAVLEPISPAPFISLQMDVDRLIGLIPVTEYMTTERHIYNDSLQSDLEHIKIFNEALFRLNNLPDAPYWNAASAGHINPKLARKIEQFEHRGSLVAYDLEPFHDEDWAILHFGVGRRPRKHNPFARFSSEDGIDQNLEVMSRSIALIVEKMPPHHVYLAKFLDYLERRHVSEL